MTKGPQRNLTRALAASIAVTLTSFASAVSAQEAGAAPDSSGAADTFPANTLVARLSIDPEPLSSVTNSAELVSALREHLTFAASMPLDEDLRVHLRGAVGNPAEGGSFPFLYSGLGYDLEANESSTGGFSAVVRGSHGPGSDFDDSDWDEDEAWAWLLDAINTGLTGSLAADGRFATDDDGHVSLRVVGVQTASAEEWDVEEGLERMYLKLQPGPRFSSSAMAGWEPPEGFASDVQRLFIELEPGPLAELPSVELSSEVLDRLAGDYEIQPGLVFNVRREGDALMVSTVGKGPDGMEASLNAMSETRFWSDIDGRRTSFTFEVGEDGHATSVTMEEGGFSMTWPRIP